MPEKPREKDGTVGDSVADSHPRQTSSQPSRKRWREARPERRGFRCPASQLDVRSDQQSHIRNAARSSLVTRVLNGCASGRMTNVSSLVDWWVAQLLLNFQSCEWWQNEEGKQKKKTGSHFKPLIECTPPFVKQKKKNFLYSWRKLKPSIPNIVLSIY